MPMGNNSTIFYLVNNADQNQKQVLSENLFENKDDDDEVTKCLNGLEFKVHDEVLKKIFDFAKKFTV